MIAQPDAWHLYRIACTGSCDSASRFFAESRLLRVSFTAENRSFHDPSFSFCKATVFLLCNFPSVCWKVSELDWQGECLILSKLCIFNLLRIFFENFSIKLIAFTEKSMKTDLTFFQYLGTIPLIVTLIIYWIFVHLLQLGLKKTVKVDKIIKYRSIDLFRWTYSKRYKNNFVLSKCCWGGLLWCKKAPIWACVFRFLFMLCFTGRGMDLIAWPHYKICMQILCIPERC
jgi:hypothetical protein